MLKIWIARELEGTKEHTIEDYTALQDMEGWLVDYYFEDDEDFEYLNGETKHLETLKGALKVIDDFKDEYDVKLIIGLLVDVYGCYCYDDIAEILEEGDFSYFEFDDSSSFNENVNIFYAHIEYYNIEIPEFLECCIDYNKYVHNIQHEGWKISNGYAFLTQ